MQRVSTFMVTSALGIDRLAEQARGPPRTGRWRGHGASHHSQRGRGATLHSQRGRGATLHSQRGRGATLHSQRGRGATRHGQRGHGATSQLARPVDILRAGSFITGSAGAALQLAKCCSGRSPADHRVVWPLGAGARDERPKNQL